jgi:oligopeptide/dipeptide ABC transporter ATP-binding protein
MNPARVAPPAALGPDDVIDGAPLHVSVANLTVRFPASRTSVFGPKRWVHAVEDISLTIPKGQTLGLVGESGCGKSTTGRAILQLVKPVAGTVRVGDQVLTELSGRQMRKARKSMQMIFQDPFSSLDARMRIGAAIKEPLQVHGIATGEAADKRVLELLDAVGLPASSVRRFPHEFSGGQRQRIAIARALAVDPTFLVCDEPISSLDVSVQAQVINLLQDLQDTLGLTYLFIAHDLAAVRQVSHRIAVMYLGRIVETMSRDDLSTLPLHPYTQSLMSSVPSPDLERERRRERIILVGEVPSPISPPSGCSFHTRCPFAQELCRVQTPPLETAADGRQVACHFWREIQVRGTSSPA